MLGMKLKGTVHIYIVFIFFCLVVSLEILSQNKFQNSPVHPKENDKREKKDWKLRAETPLSSLFLFQYP